VGSRSHRLVVWGHLYDGQPHEEDKMQFVLVIHHGTFPLPGTPESESLSEEERKRVLADYNALNAMENVTPGPPLGLPENATTVRVANGSTVATEGPYLDGKSAVGGWFVLEAEDVDAAIAIASRVPQARLGGAVEVRPTARYW
jgi:hypothetical protein